MRSKLILNDIHLGVSRQSGTTPATQKTLQEHLMRAFRGKIMENTDRDLLLLGDLFDGFLVEARIVLDAYYALSDWLFESEGDLILVPGNHDWSPKADRVSSFHFMARCLDRTFPGRVKIIDKPSIMRPWAGSIYIIPHMPNQDLFEAALAEAESIGGGALLLHCNIMSPFATHHDHSLDVNEAWMRRLAKVFGKIIFAHEHQHRELVVTAQEIRPIQKGEVAQIIALGNQWPSSVADCLSFEDRQADETKYCHILELDGDDITISREPTWKAEDDFLRIDWHDLDKVPVGPRFVRVEGSALANEAAEAVNAIAKYRQVSSALVITNSVKVAGNEGLAKMAQITFDNVKKFNVLDALLERLEPREQDTIREVMKND
jgi:hypothetical protein